MISRTHMNVTRAMPCQIRISGTVSLLLPIDIYIMGCVQEDLTWHKVDRLIDVTGNVINTELQFTCTTKHEQTLCHMTKNERRRIWIFTKCIKSHCFNPHFTQNLYRHISKIENNNLPVSDLVRWERCSIYQSRSYVSVRQYSLQSACMHLACTLHAPELKSSNFLYPVCITYTSAIFIRTLTGFIFE